MMRALVLVLALSLLVGVSGCGGKDVSTGPSKNTASFTNEFAPGQIYGPWAFTVDIPTAHQNFELSESERKVVELVADDGSTEFEFTVTRKGKGDTKTAVVSKGDRVAISPTMGQRSESWKILINDEAVEE